MQFTTSTASQPDGILWTATAFDQGLVAKRQSGLADSMGDAIIAASRAIHSMRQSELSHWEQR